MIRIPLPGDDGVLLLAPRWSSLEPAWQIALLAALLLAPAALVVWLYRYELRLVSRPAATLFLGVRLLLLLAIWFVAGWQPIVVHEQTEQTPSRVLIAVDLSGSMNVRDPQRTPLEKLRLARALQLHGEINASVLDSWITAAAKDAAPSDNKEAAARASLFQLMDNQTRAEIVRRLLQDKTDLLQRLAAQHQVEIAGFDRSLWSVNANQLGTFFGDAAAKRSAAGTDLRRPLLRALERAGAEAAPLVAVIVLTDGQHNSGPSPLGGAGELGERRVPVYPVAIGSRRPPADIAVLEVKTPGNVFKDVDTPVEVRVKVTGLPAQEIRVELQLADAKPAPDHVRTLKHDGKDQVYPVSFQVRLEQTGTHTLEIKAAAAKPEHQEVTLANNTMPVVVRVTDDKIKVLLIDGEARWEYHYLATTLGREKTMSMDRVLFLQPRVGELSEQRLEEIGNPWRRLPEIKEGEDSLRKYDCILLGDVLPEQLALADRRRLERYVAEHGGTLIVSAGKRAMPAAFLGPLTPGPSPPKTGARGEEEADDPLGRLMPITEPLVVNPESGFALTLTAEGRTTAFMQLEASTQANVERWEALPRHGWGVIGRARPGAEPLAFLPDEEPAAKDKDAVERRRSILVRQNYGFGRVLFVGVDSTWRWRYRVGDLYHHRFWSQLVRWAASEKLLPAGNRFVRYGSRQPVYREGQDVEIAARLGEEVPLLKPRAIAQARLLTEGNVEPIAVVPLTPAVNRPRLLQVKLANLPAGTYRIELHIPDIKSKLDVPPDAEEAKIPRRDAFIVQPPPDGEMFDLATNWLLLESLAARGNGEVFTPETIDELVQRLARQTVRRERREPQRLWQDAPLVWWFLGVVLGLLTVEWAGRKLAGLP